MFAYPLENFRDSLWRTMHSLWCGCSMTLSHLGVAPEDIARHVGWKSLETTEYYFQTGKVMGLYYYSTFAETGIPSASLVANVLHDKNELRSVSYLCALM